ncbi:longitudinals lacking protein, isoforms H/M/V isoform X5 [Episyrphus balteatus]|uniref:longitudinals lacking protein, isoforms H/M/V isoform X5 n=1 Tax=Episyrphus balteatus TaxID=286459 RepID=UPI0024851E1D|nr:longitudinals lacking protein, isoforms H/M/V isoform X5 [Episyrphus balteatus]
MDDDQQFCLRWNNHQSTLISVFDTLLENETLVDCTLAAEGKFLKAHKVVLSACSPYFATLLSEQYDKHPIFILKDVKYQELRAMMDYMYRGEVNISQDQLAALLKAAESLQIKGLSDNRTGSGNSSSGLGVGGSQQQQQQKISAEQQQHKHISVPGKLMTGSASAGYTLEQTKRSRIGPSSIDSQDLSGSREGSSSPTSRRRKKVRRRSIENVLADNHDNSNSSQVIQAGTSLVPTTNATGTITAMLPMVGSGVAGTTTTIAGTIASTVSAVTSSLQQQHQQQQTSAASAAANIITANVTKKTESVKMGGNTDAMNAAVTSIENIQDENAADSIDEKEMLMKEKQNHKRPKHHHEGGVVATSTGKDEIVIEPKSEYDDEGNDETVEDLTLDDEEMGLEDLDHNAGPSHGGEGSSQGYAQWQVDRSQDEVYMAAQEAQQRDPQDMTLEFEQSMTVGDRFPCSVCGKSYLRKRHLQRHMRDECIGIPPRFKCDLCPSRFRRKYHMVRHMTSKHGIPANDGPENLSMKKEYYENENVPGPGYSVIHHNAAAAAAAAVAAVAAAQAGGNIKYECVNNGGGGANVPPTSTSMPTTTMPSYGLTGAIAAYPTSASAAAVAAATAAALSGVSSGAGNGSAGSDDDQQQQQHYSPHDLSSIKEEPEPKILKFDPMSPSKGIAMDDDWKMKLSLQLISNSLLKERLMNSMPFAYNNN